MQVKEDNYPRITDQFLKKLLSSDIRMYYITKYLNDKLYLHYKGFRKIENMNEFTGLKVLYIEGNALEKTLKALKIVQTSDTFTSKKLHKSNIWP